MTMIVCGPAKGTKAKPYRCICCRRTFADIDALAVSICWECMGGNARCQECRRRGIFVNDFRVGTHYGPDGSLLPEYDPQGGLGHRLHHYRGSLGVMNCGKCIPRKHFGGGVAVVPPCGFCWPGERMAAA
jgi:hypothetical protein